jgi:DNA-binding transcriptional LysR family regulator
VTRQIVLLEQHFGVRLFHRTTRRLSLTDDGEMLVGHARTVLDAVEGIEEALGRQSSSPTGLVRLGVSTSGARFLATRLPLLLERHPGLKVELVVHDRLGDMVEERLDLALPLGELNDSSLRMRLVRMVTLAVVAAPVYLERRGAPLVPADLANHTCLVHDAGPDSDLWHFTSAGEMPSVRVSGGFIADNSVSVRLAALAGHGICMLPDARRPDGPPADRVSVAAHAVASGVSVATQPGAADACGYGFPVRSGPRDFGGACHRVRAGTEVARRLKPGGRTKPVIRSPQRQLSGKRSRGAAG